MRNEDARENIGVVISQHDRRRRKRRDRVLGRGIRDVRPSVLRIILSSTSVIWF